MRPTFIRRRKYTEEEHGFVPLFRAFKLFTPVYNTMRPYLCLFKHTNTHSTQTHRPVRFTYAEKEENSDRGLRQEHNELLQGLCEICPHNPPRGARRWRGLYVKRRERDGKCAVEWFGFLRVGRLVSDFLETQVLYCPAVFGHFSPAPVKTDRAVRVQ